MMDDNDGGDHHMILITVMLAGQYPYGRSSGEEFTMLWETCGFTILPSGSDLVRRQFG
jgi:hypothetical protein